MQPKSPNDTDASNAREPTQDDRSRNPNEGSCFLVRSALGPRADSHIAQFSATLCRESLGPFVDETHGRERFAAEWLRHRGLAWAVDLLPEPQLDPLAGRREDAGQLPLALKDTTP